MAGGLEQLIAGMEKGSDWDLMGRPDEVRALLQQVLDERLHKVDSGRYQIRANVKDPSAASYAGFITAEDNPTSGPYQGTCFVWFPGDGGSVAALAVGKDGFGADAAILGRPGHQRRLRALARLHAGTIWVKP